MALENLSSCRKVLKLSQERLTIKVFRPLRRSVKGVAFEIHHLLKKVDGNFMVALPRERKGAGLHLTDNAKCLQAQLALPREREAANLHLADNANWVQAQPALPHFPGNIPEFPQNPVLLPFPIRKKCTVLLQNVYIFSLFLFKKYRYNHK